MSINSVERKFQRQRPCLAYVTKYKLRDQKSHIRMTDNEEGNITFYYRNYIAFLHKVGPPFALQA